MTFYTTWWPALELVQNSYNDAVVNVNEIKVSVFRKYGILCKTMASDDRISVFRPRGEGQFLQNWLWGTILLFSHK